MLDRLVRLTKLEIVHQANRRLAIRIRKGPLSGARLKGNIFYNRRSDALTEEERIYDALELQNAVIVEAGSHIGLYTMLLSRKVGSRGLVVAVEPHPVNYKILRTNLEMNHCANVRAIEAGLGSEITTMWFTTYRYSTETGSFRNDRQSRTRNGRRIEFKVKVRTVDEIVTTLDIRNVDFVKIDTEGFEAEVIRGMKQCMQRSNPLIYFELHGSTVDKKIEDFVAISNVLAAHGYIARICAKDMPVATSERVRARGGCACLAYRGSNEKLGSVMKMFS
jgi:FkbM family methyltransferase